MIGFVCTIAIFSILAFGVGTVVGVAISNGRWASLLMEKSGSCETLLVGDRSYKVTTESVRRRWDEIERHDFMGGLSVDLSDRDAFTGIKLYDENG